MFSTFEYKTYVTIIKVGEANNYFLLYILVLCVRMHVYMEVRGPFSKVGYFLQKWVLEMECKLLMILCFCSCPHLLYSDQNYFKEILQYALYSCS